jgi:phospholipid-transporting ATPase
MEVQSNQEALTREELVYQATSPDELALVERAARMGYSFCKRTSQSMGLNVHEALPEEWEILYELPFDSNRKRMSLLLHKRDSEEWVLMSKGADSVMIPRLKPLDNGDMLARTLDFMEQYAHDGL